MHIQFLCIAAVGVVFAGFGIVSAQDKLAPIAITAFGKIQKMHMKLNLFQ